MFQAIQFRLMRVVVAVAVSLVIMPFSTRAQAHERRHSLTVVPPRQAQLVTVAPFICDQSPDVDATSEFRPIQVAGHRTLGIVSRIDGSENPAASFVIPDDWVRAGIVVDFSVWDSDRDNNSVIFLTFDEDNDNLSIGDGNEGRHVYFSAIPNQAAIVSGDSAAFRNGRVGSFDHYTIPLDFLQLQNAASKNQAGTTNALANHSNGIKRMYFFEASPNPAAHLKCAFANFRLNGTPIRKLLVPALVECPSDH